MEPLAYGILYTYPFQKWKRNYLLNVLLNLETDNRIMHILWVKWVDYCMQISQAYNGNYSIRFLLLFF